MLLSGRKLAVALFSLILSQATVAFGGADQASPQESAGRLVNLARTGIAHISASSVNGDRPADRYYGVRNAFDEGSNTIDGINYSYWLSNPEPRHWLRLSFDTPVTVKSIVVRTADAYRPTSFSVEFARIVGQLKRIVRESDAVPVASPETHRELPSPVTDVNEVTVFFPGPDTIAVADVRVMGTAPAGTDTAARTPAVAPGPRPPQPGQHVVSIQRTVRTDNDLRMIRIAESAYPPRSDVVRTAEADSPRSRSLPDDEKLWWYDEGDGVRIPFAITAEAVEWYRKLVESYRTKVWPKTDLGPFSSFNYLASASFKKVYTRDGRSFGSVYVVEMNLSFGVTWGSTAAVGFHKDRTVVLDRSGKVLAIFGDGKTSVWVS